MLPHRKNMVALSIRNSGILEFLKTRYMVFASPTYLDSFNIRIGLCSYKALMVFNIWFLEPHKLMIRVNLLLLLSSGISDLIFQLDTETDSILRWLLPKTIKLYAHDIVRQEYRYKRLSVIFINVYNIIYR